MLMLVAPQELPGPSFQMSFSAVLALISGYDALRPWLLRLRGASWQRRLGYNVLLLALSSVLAGTAAAPYGAYHFGRMQVYFVLANMIAVPLATLTVPLGLIGMFLMPLHLEALALVPMGWSAQAVIWIARATVTLPDAAFHVPHITAWGLCLFSLGFVWLGIWRTPRRFLGIVAMVVGLGSPLLDHPPDLLVSEDARLIAVRTEQGAFMLQTQGGSKFVRDAWAQYWGVESLRPLPDQLDPVVNCEDGACMLRPYPDRPGAMLARGARHPSFCAQISVIVSAEPARGLCPRPWPQLVDRFVVWRKGSAAIWLEPDGVRIVTDRTERGERPWVPPPPRPRKPPAPTLPAAPVDRTEQPEPTASVPTGDASNGG
jgi:competence protein ComEC